MSNKDKIILDLCGGTGAWSKPYLDNGYMVINVTLPEYDVITYMPPENVYGVLAAPVCTMFSLARTRAKTPRDFKQGMELVIACLNIIWECRYKNKLSFWCMENPMGYLRQFIGKPVFTFDPCDFGEPYTKKTDLWGYFNIPKKQPVKLTEEQKYLCSQNNRKLPSISEITGSKQAAKRAITPPGFAKAFYKANK
jgi:hypothetical protein